MPSAERTGLPCTVLFADLCDSTDLYDALGNARAQAAIVQMLTTLSQSTARHLGRVIKTIGAEIMCIFSTPQRSASRHRHAALSEAGCGDPGYRREVAGGPGGFPLRTCDLTGNGCVWGRRKRGGSCSCARQTWTDPLYEGNRQGASKRSGRQCPGHRTCASQRQDRACQFTRGHLGARGSDTGQSAQPHDGRQRLAICLAGRHDDRSWQCSAHTPHGAGHTKRICGSQSSCFARPRTHRASPGPLHPHRSKLERNVPVHAGRAGDRSSQR